MHFARFNRLGAGKAEPILILSSDQHARLRIGLLV
jgi:hypothetical protein